MKILLAVDDQQFGERIADFAMRNARLSVAEVRVITIIPSILAYTSLAIIPDLVQEMRDETRTKGIALVLKIALQVTDAFQDSSVDEFVVEGRPAEEILSMAKQWKADLILVGSHGRQGISKLIIGSVSQAVVSHAPCSVLVVDLMHCKQGLEKPCESRKGNLADRLPAGA
jgi:nucleotide-binding universal stress UspA family protein